MPHCLPNPVLDAALVDDWLRRLARGTLTPNTRRLVGRLRKALGRLVLALDVPEPEYRVVDEYAEKPFE